MFKLPVFRTPISNSFSTNSLVVYLCGSQYHLIIDNLLFFSMDGNKIVQLVCGDFDMPIEFKHFSLNRTSNNENTWFPFKYPCIVSNPLCIVNEIISIFPLLFPLARFFLLISIALFRLYTFIRFRSFSFNRSLVCVRSVGFLKSFSQNPIYSFSAQLFFVRSIWCAHLLLRRELHSRVYIWCFTIVRSHLLYLHIQTRLYSIILSIGSADSKIISKFSAIKPILMSSTLLKPAILWEFYFFFSCHLTTATTFF